MSAIVQFPQPAYQQIEDELQTVFYQPDLEAFRIILCVAASHLLCKFYPPTWLMLIGPSGSGKSTGYEILYDIPNLFKISDITPKTFMSAYKGPKGEELSLLHRMGSSAIMVMKDFTTVLAMRYENKSEIMSQLREIHDGHHHKSTGVRSVPSWTGRLTLMTCCTPAVDKDRMTLRSMGDRFVELRWIGPGRGVGRFMKDRKVVTSYTKIRQLVKEYITAPRQEAAMSDELSDLLEGVAILVATARTPVTWDDHGKQIISVDTPEAHTRLYESFASIAMASAALDSRDEVSADDIRLSLRVAMDCVPTARLAVIKAMVDNDGVMDERGPAFERMSPFTRVKALKEVQALGIAEVSTTDDDVSTLSTLMCSEATLMLTSRSPKIPSRTGRGYIPLLNAQTPKLI
jgi:hypothetical protein